MVGHQPMGMGGDSSAKKVTRIMGNMYTPFIFILNGAKISLLMPNK